MDRSVPGSASLRRMREALRGGADLATATGLVLPPGPRCPARARWASSGLAVDACEIVAFELGLKPVVFLVVDAWELPRWRARLATAHCVVDPRPDGRFGFFAARQPELAEEAAALQREDPTRHVRRLGILMGYPPCCIEAFAAQDDRGDDARNRYACAARTRGPAPWPWPLCDAALRLVPFFPCRYDCAAALTFAHHVLAELEIREPGTTERLRARLERAIFFVDEGIALGVGPDDCLIVATRSIVGLETLGATLACADRIRDEGDTLVGWRGPDRIFAIPRCAPRLGLCLPFR